MKTKIWLLLPVVGLLLAMTQHFPERGEKKVKEFLVTDFGALPDGKTLNTRAIQNAIDAAHKRRNGGKVVFTAGNYLTGSIQLKSDVHLYFEENAQLLGSTNPADYHKMQFPGRPESPKKDDNSQMALILAHKAKNIKLSGKGRINGQGLSLALHIDSYTMPAWPSTQITIIEDIGPMRP